MPPTSSQKRPGVLAWGLFALAVLVGVGIILNLIGTLTPAVSRDGAGGSTVSSRGGVASRGMLTETSDFAAPSAAPIPAEFKGGAPSAPSQTTSAPEQRIIKTGGLELRVADAGKASDRVKTVVTGKGGFIESSAMNDTGEGPRTAELVVRVPVSAFEQTMSELKGIAVVVLNEEVSGQDITEEFVDLEADIRNSRAAEASYLENMKRSGKIEEVLMVAERLADVRGRIQRLEGRQRFLENRTDLATIGVSLTEETRVTVPTRTWKPLEVLRQSGLELVQTLQAFVDFLIRFVIGLAAIIPFLAFTALIVWLGWKLVKWFMGRMR